MLMRLYHNPRCSKSRQALALLNERGVDVDVVRYLEVGIHTDDLDLLGELEGIVRSKDAGKEVMAGLQTSADIKTLLKAQPNLLERPVLVHNGRAVVGRPPENILELLD